MNARLQIAGLINYPSQTQRAMTWTRSGGVRHLGTFGGRYSRAYGVNDSGQVVGYAQNRAGERLAFIWTAQRGLQDLNKLLRHAPPGLVLDDALSINARGAIVATSNAGIILLEPDRRPAHGHVLGPLVLPARTKAGVVLQAKVAYVDEARIGTRSVSWSWGDGSAAQAGQLRTGTDGGQTQASHRYAAAGIYPVRVDITDRNGRTTSVSQQVVVTDGAGATLAGAGTVLSPLKALKQGNGYAGPASFSLIAPVATGAQALGMSARLHFDLPGLNLRSQQVDFLGQQDGQHVFEGSGSVRGAEGYQFRLATTASVPGSTAGRFALKIWHTDPQSGAQLVDYDNTDASRASTQLMDGQIVLE